MKTIYVTKDFNSLFVMVDELHKPEFHFDLLDDGKLKKVNYDKLIKVSRDCKLFAALIKNEVFKFELVDILFSRVEDKANYLGMNERTYYRARSLK
jgi:hypothetical protein